MLSYVVVQFYPWFKFYFPLFQTHALSHSKVEKSKHISLKTVNVKPKCVRENTLANRRTYLYGNDFHVTRANYFTHYKTQRHEKKGDQCRNNTHVARPKYFTFYKTRKVI